MDATRSTSMGYGFDLRILIVHQMAHVFQADDPPTHVVLGRKLTCPLKK